VVSAFTSVGFTTCETDVLIPLLSSAVPFCKTLLTY
jgi:hypothetical protein